MTAFAASSIKVPFNQLIESDLAGFTCSSGAVVPSGHIAIQASGVIVVSPATTMTHFTVTGNGPFVYTVGGTTYTGKAVFAGEGNLLPSVTQLTITSTLTINGSDGRHLSTTTIGTYNVVNGVTHVNTLKSPDCSNPLPIPFPPI